MNLLSYKNRFKSPSLIPANFSEVNGYMFALTDLLKYMEEITQFNPDKRFIDSVDILNAISETNAALTKITLKAESDLKEAFSDLAGVNLGSDKVNQFLKEQTTDPNDLKDVL